MRLTVEHCNAQKMQNNWKTAEKETSSGVPKWSTSYSGKKLVCLVYREKKTKYKYICQIPSILEKKRTTILQVYFEYDLQK